MKIQLTRNSVCAGDDVDATHTRTMSFTNEAPLDSVIDEISRSAILPPSSEAKLLGPNLLDPVYLRVARQANDMTA